MAFLRINGLTVPVTSCEETQLEIGSRGRSFGGSPLTDRRAVKREWTVTAKPQREADALALIGLVQGRGQYFPLTSDLYSTKGLAISGATDSGLVTAAGRLGVTDDAYAAFSGTNLLTVNQSNVETDTTGFTAQGTNTAIARSSTQAKQGTYSLSVTDSTSPANGDGVRVNATSISSSTDYLFQFQLYHDIATKQYTVTAVGNVSGTLGTLVISSPTVDTWEPHALQFTTGGSDTTVYFDILVSSYSSGNVGFYVDALALYASSSTLPVPWVAGGSAIDSTGATAGLGASAISNWSISFWARSTIPASAIQQVWGIQNGETGGNHAYGYINTGGTFYAGLYDSGVTMTGASAFTDTDWHMGTVVSRISPETGQHEAQMFVDGVSVDTDNTGTPVPIPANSTLYVAGPITGTGDMNESHLSELSFHPYAMTAAQVSALYAMTGTSSTVQASLPRFYIDGDIVPEGVYTVTCEGEVTGANFSGRVDSGTWYNNHREIEFTIREV